MSLAGKWMYNTGSEENWQCDEGEFETKEEAIAAGIKYFTEPDGYESYEGEPFEGDEFDVGLVSHPTFSIDPWYAIEQAQEQAGEQCGDWASNWLDKVSNEDEAMLRDLLTNTFNEWIMKTSNTPNFFTIEKIHTVKLDKN